MVGRKSSQNAYNTSTMEVDELQQQKFPLLSVKNRNMRLQTIRKMSPTVVSVSDDGIVRWHEFMDLTCVVRVQVGVDQHVQES